MVSIWQVCDWLHIISIRILLSKLQICVSNVYSPRSQVLQVKAANRIGELNIYTCMRHTLADHYGNKPVGLGGTFLLHSGKAKIHVMVSSESLWWKLCGLMVKMAMLVDYEFTILNASGMMGEVYVDLCSYYQY